MRIVTRVTQQVQVSAGGVRDLGYHVVWCPKCRRPVLAGRLAGQREALIRGKAGEHGWRIMTLEIMPDHVHLFVEAHRSGSPSRVASQFNGFTSRRPRAGFPHLRSRWPAWWSRPYFATTVGAVPAQTVCRYTGTQDGRRWREERAR
jgi:putative transposase